MHESNAVISPDLRVPMRKLAGCFHDSQTKSDSNALRLCNAKDSLNGAVRPPLENVLVTASGLAAESSQVLGAETQPLSITFAEFVQTRFVPECVASRRLSGRIHFQFILRHVLTPEQVIRAFGSSERKKETSAKLIPGWPYLGSLSLNEIDGVAIQLLTSTALRAGYSSQTAIHIRNVISSVFAHAIRTQYFVGQNPASLVKFPAAVRKASHALTISQLRQAIGMMRSPEKQMALLAILTDMNLSEICGLQWRCVNLTNHARQLESEPLSPRTIAVRNQSYRGEFTPVTQGRRRFVPIPNLLFSVLSELKSREKFSDLHDFVLASRKGTPISPENVGTRKLKAVGRVLDIPWLSWSAFQRTRLDLIAQLGQRMNRELEQILPIHESAIANHRPKESSNTLIRNS